MIFQLFRAKSNTAVVDRLYAAVMSASRDPVLYADYGIPDSFEGRFESLTLHAFLVLRRLQTSERPGPDMSQHLTDTIFRHFDRTLREMGVGDTSVPKRMKSFAEAFLGRSTAYEAAFKDGSLAAVLGRNVYAGRRSAAELASYVEAVDTHLSTLPLQAYIDGNVQFPRPKMIETA